MSSIRALTALWSPAPLIIVELSLVAIIFLAEPRLEISVSSSFIPLSSEMTVAPVRTAISSRISLRRSPKAGAFRTRELKTPLSLLRTRSERASPLTSSAIMTRSLWPDWATFSRTGRISLLVEIFLSVKRMRGLSKIASWRLRSVTKNGEL